MVTGMEQKTATNRICILVPKGEEVRGIRRAEAMSAMESCSRTSTTPTPALFEDSREAAEVRRRGFEIATEGQRIPI